MGRREERNPTKKPIIELTDIESREAGLNFATCLSFHFAFFSCYPASLIYFYHRTHYRTFQNQPQAPESIMQCSRSMGTPTTPSATAKECAIDKLENHRKELYQDRTLHCQYQTAGKSQLSDVPILSMPTRGSQG